MSIAKSDAYIHASRAIVALNRMQEKVEDDDDWDELTDVVAEAEREIAQIHVLATMHR